MNAVNPTIMQSLAPFMGSMGMSSASPSADAAEHFDNLADTYFVPVEYLGLKLTAEVNRVGDRLVDLLQDDGTCWYEEFSERALRKIRNLALEAA